MKEYILIRDAKVHLNEELANLVMEHIHYTDETGVEYSEPFWTIKETTDFSEDKPFPEGTTKWDIWVALNLFYSDTCKVLDAKQALEAGYQFYFNDEDAPKNKLYRYIKAMGLV